MFVVTGITGNTGAAAADALLHAGHRVRALVRDPAKAGSWARKGVELITGDVMNREALRRAFEGASGAYILVPPHPQHPDPVANATQVAQAVAQASRDAGLERLVLLSSEGAHLPSGTGPIRGLHEAERILAGAAPRLTYLRATYFQENWHSVFPVAREQGVLPTFLTDVNRPRPMVAARDIGRTAADLLTAADAPAIVELKGPRDLTVVEAASIIGSALGRSVTPVQPPREAWAGILMQAGLGQAYAKLLAEMYDGINSEHVRFEGVPDQRRGPTELADTVASWTLAKAA
ncbi:MAG TPA: NmrA family NAD(P)-binding protein [Beijerinckiaceae bacterium]|jgi:uncharacterized protein YbjT (DUF2867 family)